ncbi:lipoprotein [Streptomyces phaeofaciens JCM 4814]|uniref:Multiple inositol polyphosphate phosphatase 1 n=1 Tax=Streptomyces phaeofaciens TaxID=68254 RepID=A0A918H598_9ACTN|nr:histidine-type phosphatase [Streptomyces phaeofaciens]GGT39484.1 lipoprotein [Streptomyces phaeofaciens]
MNRVTPALGLALGALVLTALPAHADSAGHLAHRDSYGTKAVYAPGQSARTYQRPPAGFTPVFTENVSRHGSRAASDSEDGDLVLALWDKAEAAGGLTGKGEKFGPTVRALQAAMAKVGYGNLSGRGKEEMRDTAARTAERLPSLFAGIARTGEKIDVVSSGQGRAVDSADLYAAGLADSHPALEPLIGATRTDKDLLYFHKADGGAAYRDYLANDRRLADTLAAVTDQPKTRAAARSVLRRLFTAAFVNGLSASDQVDAARAVYDLYAIAPAMSEESPDGRGWGMQRYISASDAAWFGYLGDAEDFYEKGPGFVGSDITYRMADVLLDDFFARIEDKKAGTSTLGAELRFTHAEEIIPLATLMGLPGSTEQVTEDKPYTYAGNAWRGAEVAPLGSNIQWDVYEKNGRWLVRMLYNEKETAFRASCRPITKGSTFYDFDELERCFGRA